MKLFEQIFKIIQEKGGICEKEMYSVFNMGIGMILVVGNSISKKVLNSFRKFNLNSYVIGEVVKMREKIKLL